LPQSWVLIRIFVILGINMSGTLDIWQIWGIGAAANVRI
jgi:hypothetical protein